MKSIIVFVSFLLISFSVCAQEVISRNDLQKSLDQATAVIRDAFRRGDIELIVRLHSPEIEKYFGGNNVTVGRENLKKGLQGWLSNTSVDFIENKVESTVFVGETAIQTVVFGIKSTPKNGGKPSIGRGRSMVVYIQSKDSPTGWLTLREMGQEAPPGE